MSGRLKLNGVEEGTRKDWPGCWCCFGTAAGARKDWRGSRKECRVESRTFDARSHCEWYISPFPSSYPVLVPGRVWIVDESESSCLMVIVGIEPSSAEDAFAEVATAAAAAAPLFARDWPPLLAAVMEAWREVRSCIMRSFWSCLSAWTVCACWRRLSRRENCLPQWQVNGLSPVCFLERGQKMGKTREGLRA